MIMAKTRKALRKHAKKRAKERYDLDLNSLMFHTLEKQIRDNKSTFIEKASNRETLHIVEIAGVRMPVVYDKIRNSIVTVLPKHVIRKWMAIRERRLHG